MYIEMGHYANLHSIQYAVVHSILLIFCIFKDILNLTIHFMHVFCV